MGVMKRYYTLRSLGRQPSPDMPKLAADGKTLVRRAAKRKRAKRTGPDSA